MNKLFQNPFANPDKSGQVVRKIVTLGVVCMLLFAGCNKKEQHFERVTGTIIGVYSDGSSASYLVQVDRRYPIGETLNEYSRGFCAVVYRDGVFTFDIFPNVIQIQPRLHLLLSDWPTREVELKMYDYTTGTDVTRIFKVPILDHTITGTRISFSYREVRRREYFPYVFEEERFFFLVFGEDIPLVGNICFSPSVPTFIVTDIQILN